MPRLGSPPTDGGGTGGDGRDAGAGTSAGGGGSVVRPWLPAFEAVSYCAVATNCALMALAARGSMGVGGGGSSSGGGGGPLAWLARGGGPFGTTRSVGGDDGSCSDARLLLACVALEHALLAVKLMLSRALPT